MIKSRAARSQLTVASDAAAAPSLLSPFQLGFIPTSALWLLPQEAVGRFSALEVEDSRTVLTHCRALSQAFHAQKEAAIANLERLPGDQQPLATMTGWRYALETMIQQASSTGDMLAGMLTWTGRGL